MPVGSNSQDLVRIKEIRQNIVIMENGTMVQMVLVNGINVALKSAEEQSAIIRGYQNFLNSIDFTVQISIHSRKINIDKYLSSLDEQKNQEKSGLLQNQISEYQEFIRSFVQEYAVMRKMFVIAVPFIPISILPKKNTGNPLFSLFGKKTKKDETDTKDDQEAFKEATNQLRQRVLQIIEGLKVIGLDSTILNDEQIIELLYNFYNPETIEKEHLVFPQKESEQKTAPKEPVVESHISSGPVIN
jgi:hypothetical protein